MRKNTKPDEQHIIPRVYLKYFRIVQNENFVHFINFADPFRKNVQTKGINDRVFKETRFYNSSALEDPYWIEKFFGKNIENDYNLIMQCIEKKGPLTIELIEKIITWLCFSKARSTFMRDWYNSLINKTITFSEMWKRNKLTPEFEEQIKEYSKIRARECHLSFFYEIDWLEPMLNQYFKHLLAKRWIFVRSLEHLPFWTSDNPGFSPNLNIMFNKETPFHSIMELNRMSIVYYVLSSDYCLVMIPEFEPRVDRDLVNVSFLNATEAQIDQINTGVFFTKNKLLISKSKSLFDRYLKLVD